MPRVRGPHDLRTTVYQQQKSKQLDRLLLHDSLRLTTSKLSEPALRDVLSYTYNAQSRRMNLRKHRRRNILKSPNDGYLVAIKDNFVTRTLPTTCASDILEGFSARDATAVKLLEQAGLRMVAKTNMDEFGMGSHSTHSAYGAVRNVVGFEVLSAGGSSGGSALAVSTGLVDCALGSDTGGSVRLPAAYNGIIGFKPSYGDISRRGLIPYANSLDTVGLFGTTCADIVSVYHILSQYDSEDPTSLTPQTRRRIAQTRNDRVERTSIIRLAKYSSPSSRLQQNRPEAVRTWPSLGRPATMPRRIGVPVEYNIAEMHPSVRNAWTRTLSNLQYQGHDIIPISLPSTQQALSAYYVLAPAEASSNLAKYDGVRYGKLRNPDSTDDAGGVLYSEYRGALFGEEVKQRILLGSFTLSAGAMDNYFLQAQRVRRIVRTDFDLVFRMANPLRSAVKPNPKGVDYIICPTAPTPPPKLTEVNDADPLDSYVNDVFTVPASLAGLPAISMPASNSQQRHSDPQNAIGMQVIGQFGDDLGVLHFARRWLEQDPYSDRVRGDHAYRPKFR